MSRSTAEKLTILVFLLSLCVSSVGVPCPRSLLCLRGPERWLSFRRHKTRRGCGASGTASGRQGPLPEDGRTGSTKGERAERPYMINYSNTGIVYSSRCTDHRSQGLPRGRSGVISTAVPSWCTFRTSKQPYVVSTFTHLHSFVFKRGFLAFFKAFFPFSPTFPRWRRCKCSLRRWCLETCWRGIEEEELKLFMPLRCGVVPEFYAFNNRSQGPPRLMSERVRGFCLG